jgi:hypothetical protein
MPRCCSITAKRLVDLLAESADAIGTDTKAVEVAADQGKLGRDGVQIALDRIEVATHRVEGACP